ncbi:protein-tyrosine phosphatase-like protein [Ephemerocybe angulata]|uniref:Protein-tyrosine phosphatase-like protein n=1 Tax=Ephemerocybe angulata TaxID=980116 RepID=A0A8H6I2G8_9AGAR|nr:protein-tyrosine phosphatase-like protein [Tulosesus angulatus]
MSAMEVNVASQPRLTDEQLRTVVQGPGDVEWRYEMRRECQEILPGLFLGPFVASKSLETLQSLGITHIVCIRDAKEAFSVKPRFPGTFQYMTLDVEDNEEQNLIRLFPGAKDFINTAIANGGRVLVHCNGGISLSPSFVVMFVMQYYQLSWEDALHMVQNRRYCISPNGGFLTQIKEYEAIYKANIAVASYPQAHRQASRRKRTDDDDEDEENRLEDRKRPLVKEESAEVMDPNAMEMS